MTGIVGEDGGKAPDVTEQAGGAGGGVDAASGAAALDGAAGIASGNGKLTVPQGLREELAEGGFPTDRLLTPGQVARLFGVDPKTVSRWGQSGKLPMRKTLGGHRRFPSGDVYALLEETRRRRSGEA